MSQPKYSFVIPVYNRPLEIEELLESFTKLQGDIDYEVVIVEDGSTESSETIVQTYSNQLNLKYYFKPNSGPGDSRNYGMQKASALYFIILDSDVLLTPDYLVNVDEYLTKHQVDCFGGPDGATAFFTPLQKAINFSMTSVLTTGGVRGRKGHKNFQPRSFNLGLSKAAFKATGGFGKIHPGEDPDLVFRLWDKGFKTAYIDKALVYHKRRISWRLFAKQVYKFGMVRPILNTWHPSYTKLVFWLPSLFLLGLIGAIILFGLGIPYLAYVYQVYVLMVLLEALKTTRSIRVSLMAVLAVCIQFLAYGYGFLKHSIILKFNPNKTAEELFPKLFFS